MLLFSTVARDTFPRAAVFPQAKTLMIGPIALAFVAVLAGGCGVPRSGDGLTMPPAPGRVGGLMSLPKAAGKAIGELVLGKKLPPPSLTPEPVEPSVPKDLGLGVFSFTGAIGLLAGMGLLFFDKGLAIRYLAVGTAVASVPFLAHILMPAASMLAGIAATAMAVGMCLWATSWGLNYYKLRRMARELHEQADNGATDAEEATYLLKAEAIEDLMPTNKKSRKSKPKGK